MPTEKLTRAQADVQDIADYLEPPLERLAMLHSTEEVALGVLSATQRVLAKTSALSTEDVRSLLSTLLTMAAYDSRGRDAAWRRVMGVRDADT